MCHFASHKEEEGPACWTKEIHDLSQYLRLQRLAFFWVIFLDPMLNKINRNVIGDQKDWTLSQRSGKAKPVGLWGHQFSGVAGYNYSLPDQDIEWHWLKSWTIGSHQLAEIFPTRCDISGRGSPRDLIHIRGLLFFIIWRDPGFRPDYLLIKYSKLSLHLAKWDWITRPLWAYI